MQSHNHEISGASNAADLETTHLDGGSTRRAFEKCHCYVREGRSGIALRAEVQEITRQHLEVFVLDDAVELDTQPERDVELGESPRSTTRTEHEQTAKQCNLTVRCLPDQDNTDHFRDHERSHAHDHANFLTIFCVQFIKPTLYQSP